MASGSTRCWSARSGRRCCESHPGRGLRAVTLAVTMSKIRLTVWLAALLAAVACAWLAPLDAPATRQIDAGLKRALLTFAAARALNSVISVAQGTEVSLQPLGVGVTLAPGQLLDPVNDLVELFSNLMLAASVSFGVQKVLIGMAGYWPISLALTVAAIAWSVLQFRARGAPVWLPRLLVVLLMLRFAIPVVTLGTDVLWQKFLASEYESSQQSITSVSSEVVKLAPPAGLAGDSPGMVARMKQWLAENADVKMRFEALKQAAERATLHMIKLMVIFLMQTMLIPLLLMWALYSLARGVFALPRRAAGAAPVPA
jgi:hypothetical protein